MASSRLEILKTMVDAKPEAAFGRYGLAMEYVRTGELETAVGEFETLLTHNPGYSAGYYHAGQTLEKLGRIEDARVMYRRGIDATTANGDAHTKSELIGALQMLG